MDKISEYREWFRKEHNPYGILSGIGVGILARGTTDVEKLQQYYDELESLNIGILFNIDKLDNVYFLKAPFYYRDEKRESPVELKIINISDNHEAIIKYISNYINGAIKNDSKIFVYKFIQDFAIEDDIISYVTRYNIMSKKIFDEKIKFFEE